MDVKLLSQPKLTESYVESLHEWVRDKWEKGIITDGQAIALSAIRTCYSHNEPSEILNIEGQKYFGKEATDGEGGSDADRLIRHIMKSGHTSTIEHLNFSFAVEGVSRSLLAQITRHRFMSFSVQSQRYVKFGSGDKSEGFDAVIPPSVNKNGVYESYNEMLKSIQEMYNYLREKGMPAEDARYVLPNAATCNFVMTTNLRSLLDFYKKRSSPQAQWEIRELAEKLKEEVIEVESWVKPFFGEVK